MSANCFVFTILITFGENTNFKNTRDSITTFKNKLQRVILLHLDNLINLIPTKHCLNMKKTRLLCLSSHSYEHL